MGVARITQKCLLVNVLVRFLPVAHRCPGCDSDKHLFYIVFMLAPGLRCVGACNHGLTANEYKRRFGYNRGRPLMCRALCRLYADRAVKTGLASLIRQRPILVQPELRRRGGTRAIALEELLTRRDGRRGARGQAPVGSPLEA